MSIDFYGVAFRNGFYECFFDGEPDGFKFRTRKKAVEWFKACMYYELQASGEIDQPVPFIREA